MLRRSSLYNPFDATLAVDVGRRVSRGLAAQRARVAPACDTAIAMPALPRHQLLIRAILFNGRPGRQHAAPADAGPDAPPDHPATGTANHRPGRHTPSWEQFANVQQRELDFFYEKRGTT